MTEIQNENVVVVEDAADLFSYRRHRRENIVLLPRSISGSFNELARWLLEQNPWQDVRVADKSHYIETVYNRETLEKFKNNSSMAWTNELGLICSDMQMMQDALGCQAELRVVREQGYAPGTYLFHQDGGPYRRAFQSADRVMCCYNAPTTEWIHKIDAIALPVNRGFHTFDKRAGAPVFHFAVGDIWRQACMGDTCMGDKSEALVHRAVETGPGQPPRLLVVC